MKPNLLKFFAYSKTMFFGFFILFSSFQVFAQPANDNCTGAILLTSATTCNSITGTLLGATKYTQGINGPTVRTGTWTPPSGVTSAIVECWGGGGAGGGTSASINTYSGGGGGGAYTINNALTVTSTKTYTINTGAGAIGGFGNGGNGTASSFLDGATTLVTAAFGRGGTKVDGGFGIGGAGGVGTFNGGTGASGAGTSSGAGGGGAGSTASGNNGSGITGGNGGAPDGGRGGNGSNASANGANANTYGGGGGGARRGNVVSNFAGGSGANGAVRITYADCGSVNSPDVWYTFVAQSTNPRIVISNSGNDLVAQSPSIQLLSRAGGGCGGVYTSLASVNANVLEASGLTIGNTYYIRITTNTSLLAFTSGTYSFDICVMDPLPTPLNYIDYAKSYINITDGIVGGTINQGDILEIRATLVVKTGASTITNVSFYDTLKRNAGFIFKDSIATRTNEGKVYKAFTNATGDDAGWLAPTGLDTAIQINIGAGATAAAGGTLTFNSIPNFYSTCIIMATYRVRVDTGTVGYGRKINFGGGAIQYSVGASNYTISFPRDSLIVYPTLAACSDAVSPGNLIGNIGNGTFGTLPNGSSPSGKQNGTPLGAITTYNYETVSTNVNDYYYGIVNNLSKTNSTNQTVEKVGVWPVGIPSRVFDVFDITGDHTGAIDQAKGNKPCDPNQAVSATNPCGYLMIVNAAYKSDVVFEYTAAGACAETYYEVSAWFKNICYRCGADSLKRGSGDAGYIPTAPGDSSGVRPNIAMKIDGIDYYTTGELVYQGLGGTRTGSDTLNNWVRRAFVFKTGPSQTSFKITFRNNAPGGGGNDWAIDDIGLRTCYPTMIYAPTNPIVYMGNTLTISDTVRSYFNSYSHYQWERKPVSGAWTAIPGAAGNATPVWNPAFNQFQYVINYTIPSTATLAGNSGDLYRMVVASSAANLTNGCNYTPSLSFTLLPADAPCFTSNVNYAVTPQTGTINWNNLAWSLGHPPTCCESAHITYTGTNAGIDDVKVLVTNDICIINLTLVNSATSATNKIFRTIVSPGYNMLMNGYVRMTATGALSSDSCIFITNGGGTITINGNTTIGYPADNAYSLFGTAASVTSNENYVLRGSNLTFNAKGYTNDKFMTVIMNPYTDTAYLENNTNVSPYANAVSFENLKIGNGVKTSTIITSGSNQNSFINDRGGALEVTTNATLILPANYSINARGTYNSSLQLRADATLRIGGYTGGTTGSNFPANYTTYNANALSTVDYYGGNLGTQTVYGMNYGKLELLNGLDGNGPGRAQKNSIAAIGIATLANVNKQVDFTLGALGSSTSPITNNGILTVVGGLSGAVSGGLFCNANVIAGAGSFSMGNYSTLGMGHPQGILATGANGNIQTTGTRTFNGTGNYVYNGLVNQVTGLGLPTGVNDLIIDNPTTVTLVANTTQFVNGSHLLKQGVFDIVAKTINIFGATGIMNSTGGKMKADAGTLEMGGTSGLAQNISGNWFVNKTISTLVNKNSVGFSVAASPADTVLISNALLYGSTTTNSQINTGNNLTLLSRATQTARFGEIVSGSGNTINGTVTVERFIPATRKWRLLAWPTNSSQTAKQSWMENAATPNANPKPGYGAIVTDEQAGWSANGFDSRSVSGPSVKYYNPATGLFDGIPNTFSYLMNTNSAYYTYIRGDRSSLPSPVTYSTTVLRATGTLNTGNKVYPIANGKFVAVGNPYASAIDVRKINSFKTTSEFYVWDPKLTGAYGLGAYQLLYKSGPEFRVTPGGGSYPSAGSIVDTLESGQGILVRSNGTGNGTLTFSEDAKTVGARTFTRGAGTAQAEVIFALLNIVDPGVNTLVDGAMAAFDNSYSSNVDFDDALKLTNTSENISFKRTNTLLAIERRSDVMVDDTLHLNMTGLRIKKYQWDVNIANMTNPGRTALMVDNFTNTTTNLSLEGVTNIQFDVTSTVASYAANRFMIVFKQIPMPTTQFTTISAVRNTNKTIKVNYAVANETNIASYTIEQSNNGTTFAAIGTQAPVANNSGNPAYTFTDNNASLNNNWYRVKFTSSAGVTAYSAIAMVGATPADVIIAGETKMSVYPNPVVGGNVNLHLDNQAKGTYTATVTNKMGQNIKTANIQVNTNTVLQTIKIGNAATGSYQVAIVDELGNKTMIPFIVK
jgi:hypothetical protein